jgi:hydroxymethylbilane synthase
VVAAERGFLCRLGGDCTIPMAAHCEIDEQGALRARGLIASADGQRIARAERRGEAADAAAIGLDLAEAVLADGGDTILKELRESAGGSTG